MSKNIDEVKKILSIENDNSLISYLEFCEKKIINKILDICNIEEIPERLNTLIQEFLIEQYNINKEGIGNGIKQVSSVSDREQTVNFKIVGGVSNVSKNVDEFLDRNMSVLVAYRKMRW